MGEPQGAIGELVFPPDTSEDGGAECGTYRDVSPALMEILVYLPKVTTAGDTAQTVAFWLDLWQGLPDGSVDYTGSTTEYQVPVNPGELVDPVSYTGWELPVGPAYIPVLGIAWYNDVNAEPTGWTFYWPEYVENWINRSGTWSFEGVFNACAPLVKPVSSLSPTTGPVNTSVSYRLHYFPIGIPVTATWDGRALTTATTDQNGRATGTFKVPDGQVMGPHTVSFTAGSWQATKTYTVKPRIKVTPRYGGTGPAG
jgi:hypothetical protein